MMTNNGIINQLNIQTKMQKSNSIKGDRNVVAKYCNNFDDFVDLMEEAKYTVKEIFFNGRRHDKRRTNFEDFEDMFDNKVSIKYFFNNDRLDVWIGNYSE